ncbi:unnamed protein product [Dracunculus medinensis]|uniref:guanylate kinase n=1 Tax=Dracunculus medinensis TaxID=318479 RepID=A0A0N4UD03_DRAME|nr:unnamed protein product [Dracunculus medinensis]
MSFNTRPIILSGPSGGGKSTILKKAMENYPDRFAFSSVLDTTRAPRIGEQNGIHYWFIDKASFEKMIANEEFIEYAVFSGNFYGTSKKAIEAVQKTGRICVLDVELNGVKNIRKFGLNAKYILIRAPDLQIIEDRLRQRKTETEETLQKRLNQAKEDLDAVCAQPDLFDFIIVNDDLQRAYEEFVDIIKEELEQFGPSQRQIKQI